MTFGRPTSFGKGLGIDVPAAKLIDRMELIGVSETIIVPDGVAILRASCIGCGGGSSASHPGTNTSGGGAYARTTIGVSPGQSLAVYCYNNYNMSAINSTVSINGFPFVSAQGGSPVTANSSGSPGSAAESIGDVTVGGIVTEPGSEPAGTFIPAFSLVPYLQNNDPGWGGTFNNFATGSNGIIVLDFFDSDPGVR